MFNCRQPADARENEDATRSYSIDDRDRSRPEKRVLMNSSAIPREEIRRRGGQELTIPPDEDATHNAQVIRSSAAVLQISP